MHAIKAIAIISLLPPDHPDIAYSLSNLGRGAPVAGVYGGQAEP